jgi:hypothetical protein
MAEGLATLLRIRKSRVRISVRIPAILVYSLRGFHQSLLANARKLVKLTTTFSFQI